MKIKNKDIVEFFSCANAIMKKKIPYRLYSAIDLNAKELEGAAESYNKLIQKAEQDHTGDENVKFYEDAIKEILEINIEANIQTVTPDLFGEMDKNGKYDALSGEEYRAMKFMIQEE